MRKLRENGKAAKWENDFAVGRFSGSPCYCRGSATVELLVILPVLLLVIFAMMYVGELSIFKARTHYGGQYAMDASGDQSEEAAVRGVVTEKFYDNRIGELTVVERPSQPDGFPADGELRELFDDMSRITTSVHAIGRYVLDGGELRFVVTTNESQSMSREGRYIAAYELRDRNIPELCTDLVQGWQHQHLVQLTYFYSPGYIRIGQWPLDPVELSAQFQSAVRGDVAREVADPPAGLNHVIEAVTTDMRMPNPGRPRGYPDFSGDEAFWEPN